VRCRGTGRCDVGGLIGGLVGCKPVLGSVLLVVLLPVGGDWTRCESMGQSLAVVGRGLGVNPCGDRVAGAGN
jgi:hypothetical protein